jgi:hypothetical protein
MGTMRRCRISPHILYPHEWLRIDVQTGVTRRTPYGFHDQFLRLSLATTSSWLKPLTIQPAVQILAGSMLRLLVARLPTFRTEVGD